ncbi:MAG: AAA family ATPase [Acidobacteriota bacterium]|nr:AAA family ATPase [Acidobacteriota bacterium]MDQ3421450.1 AAA family ATPase [Acidobacteriota bacterium]
MERGHYSPMAQDAFGSTEKPFAVIPDPKYLYRSASHGSVFDQLHGALRRREGFVLLTGAIGSGKTTVCRAVLEQVDRTTFTSLVLDPPASEQDLLRAMLQDFGLVSRDEPKRGRLAHASARELLATLDDFLTSLRSLGASALLVIDEAQDVPLETLDQISALSGPAGGKEKVLQIVLVGQPILNELLKSALVRELDGRITTRLELKPLTVEETSEYVSHRMMVAGVGPAVGFAPTAFAAVHRYSGGVPRLINMLCDGAMAAATSDGANDITPQVIDTAAAKLELRPTRSQPPLPWIRKPAVLAVAGLMLAASIGAAYLSVANRPSDVNDAGVSQPSASTPATAATASLGGAPAPLSPKEPTSPASTTAATSPTFSVLVASFRQPNEATALLNDLRERGLPVRQIRVVQSPRGVWHQVLVGPYPDAAAAARGQERIRRIPGYADAHVIPG